MNQSDYKNSFNENNLNLEFQMKKKKECFDKKK